MIGIGMLGGGNIIGVNLVFFFRDRFTGLPSRSLSRKPAYVCYAGLWRGILRFHGVQAKDGGRYWTRTSDPLRVEQVL